jgi:hypothetical protein
MGETLIAAPSQIGTLRSLCRCHVVAKASRAANPAHAEGRFPVRLDLLLGRHKDSGTCDFDEPDALAWRLRPHW